MSGSGTLPNLVVPGVTKAGTTSLYAYLSGHPDIHGGAGKELNLLGPMRFGTTMDDTDVRAGWAMHFQGAESATYRLDVSPQYFHGGKELITRLARILDDDARVLVTLRDPVTRLWSAYRMKRTRGRLDEGYNFDRFVDEAVAAERDGTWRTQDGNVLATVATGRYEQHLPLWLDAFGDRVRVAFFEDMAADRVAFLTEVLDWLGLDASPLEEMDLSVRNLTMRHRNRRLAAVARRAYRRLEPVISRSPRLMARLQTTYERINTDPVAERFDQQRQRRTIDLYADSLAATAGLLRDHPGLAGPPPRWITEPDHDRSGPVEAR